MNERVLQFRVGVVIVAAALLTLILMVMFTDMAPFIQGTYPVQVEFVRAPGVTVDTPVRRDGILIGRVSRIELLEPQGVLVTAEINADRALTAGQTPMIHSQFPLGNTVIEFVSLEPANQTPLRSGQRVRGSVQDSPVDALEELQDDLQEAVTALSAAARDASTLMRNVNTVVEANSEQFTTVLQKSSAALDQFQRTAANVDRLTANVERTSTNIDVAARNFATASQGVSEVFGDAEMRTNLQKTLQEMPVLLRESRETVAAARLTVSSMQDSFAGFRQTNEKLNRNLDNVERFTQRLDADGGRVLDQMERTFVDVQELLDELTNFGVALNQSEGTLGKFINDPELYLRLNQAVANIEVATQKLCPILDDARVAMDKVARDPGGTVGVRGILDRTPGGLKKVRPAGW